MEKVNVPTIERSVLDAKEGAIYLGISRDTLYKMIREKLIPHFRIGSRVLLKKEALDQWMDKLIAESIEENEY